MKIQITPIKMNRTLHPSERIQIDISFIPGLGLALGYEPRYREIVMILGCFMIVIEFKRKRKRK